MSEDNGDENGGNVPSAPKDKASWGQAATVLAETFDRALGRPLGTILQAKADVKADRIRALGPLETERQIRAATRVIAEEDRKQANIESIRDKAIPLLEADGRAEEVGDDWIISFLEKSSLVGDEEMQNVWAKLLAGELNKPGSYSRKTLEIVGSMSEDDAHLFTQLCGFAWGLGDRIVPLVFNDRDDIYQRHGITFESLQQLEMLGLISFGEGTTTYTVSGDDAKKRLMSYHHRMAQWTVGRPAQFSVGKVLLSTVGQQLIRICDPSPVEGFFEYSLEQWNRSGHDVAPLDAASTQLSPDKMPD